MREIASVDEALDLLEQVVAEQGADHQAPQYGVDEDSKYTMLIPDDQVDKDSGTCRYFTPEGKPSCIIGHVLHRLGVAPAELEPFEGSTSDTLFRGMASSMEDDAVLEGTHEVSLVLRMAQSIQDRRGTWGEALQAAQEQAARLAR